MKKLLSMLVLFLLGTGPALAQKPPAGAVQFPGILDIPLKPGLNFGGYFKQHQPVKIVFGISDPGAQMKESLTNAALTINYLKEKGYSYKIQIVLYGTAVRPADVFNQEYSGYGPLMEALHEQGVEFRVCYNSLYSLHMDASNIQSYMKLVPAGILQIVKKQMQGYYYISNR